MSALSEAFAFGLPAWMDDAACADNAILADRGLSADSWHPDSYKGQQRRQVRAAIAVCRACPVAAKCLAAALDNNEEHGIWGGTTEGQRYELIRQNKAKQPCSVAGCSSPRVRRVDDKGWVSTCETHHRPVERAS